MKIIDMGKKMNKQYFLLYFIFMLTLTSCQWEYLHSQSTENDIWRIPVDSSTLGWELDQNNTGLVDSSIITVFDLDGEDAGKGEWILGDGVRLNIYGNQTIENKYITFTHSLNAVEGGTVFRNCLIQPTNCGEGLSLVSAVNATFEYCEIDGSLLGINNIAHPGISARNSIIKNCSIHDHSGVMITNDGSVTVFINNYVYNILYEPASDDHLVGVSVFMSSGEGTQLINNRIEIVDPESALHTSAAVFTQSYFGNVSNVLVSGNLLRSASYVTRLTEGGNVTYLPIEFNNNRLELITEYGTGYGYYQGHQDIAFIPVWIENYIYDAYTEECKGGQIVY